MTRSELAARVAAQASLPAAAADRAVVAVFSAISDALASGETVTLTGFGTFSTRRREARQGRNPRTGESITIVASNVPAFKAGRTLRDAVK